MDERPPENTAERGAEETEKVINSRGGAAPARGYSVSEKGRQHWLVKAVTEKERRAADIKQKVVLCAEQIDDVTGGRGQPADQDGQPEAASLFGSAHVGKNENNAGQKDR